MGGGGGLRGVGGGLQKWCKVSRSAGEEHTFFISRVAHFSLRFLRKYATFKGPCRFMHVCVSMGVSFCAWVWV